MFIRCVFTPQQLPSISARPGSSSLSECVVGSKRLGVASFLSIQVPLRVLIIRLYWKWILLCEDSPLPSDLLFSSFFVSFWLSWGGNRAREKTVTRCHIWGIWCRNSTGKGNHSFLMCFLQLPLIGDQDEAWGGWILPLKWPPYLFRWLSAQVRFTGKDEVWKSHKPILNP